MYLVIVICLFERHWSDVSAMKQLPALAGDFARLGIRRHRLVVYDNSSSPQAAAAAAFPELDYVHDPGNGGTAAAYEFGSDLASREQADWLLLLDHDTALPTNFFPAWVRSMNEGDSEAVEAFVPWVMHESLVVSPATVTSFGSILPLSRESTPPHTARPLTAIASGSILRVAALRSLMPLPKGLWLDYVDHWIFAKIRARGGSVRIIDATLEHDLSIARPASLSRRRLLSVLEGEARFVRSLGWRARWAHPFRLARRLTRYLIVRPRLAAWMAGWMFSGFRVAP